MFSLKETLLRSLKELARIVSYREVYDFIVAQNLYNFGNDKTPASSVSGGLGNFIRQGDTRVKMIPGKGGSFFYYLTELENDLPLASFAESVADPPEILETKQLGKNQEYQERSLHKLLSTYLKGQHTYTKTIFHEISNGKDANQIWTHPDMVGVRFTNLQHRASRSFISTVNRLAGFDLYSYELKREITTDNELKKAYFQAVSNSSWANYGYLVAFTISSSLFEEIERLTQSFGIGVIELDVNPYQSKIQYQATRRQLDLKTIDKLCLMNRDFAAFIEQVSKVAGADDRYQEAAENELQRSSDSFLVTDDEIAAYCHSKHIPIKYQDTE